MQPTGDEAARLVEAELRQDEVGPRVVEREQAILVGGEAEEVVLLLDPFRNGAVDRTLAVDELPGGLELLAANAVVAGIGTLVDVAVVIDPLEEVADEGLVALIARPDEEVGMGVQARREVAPAPRDRVDVVLRAQPLLLRDSEDLRRVLVDAGEEERLGAALLLMAHEDVRGAGRVGMADVRRAVHVVDRRRQEVAHLDQ